MVLGFWGLGFFGLRVFWGLRVLGLRIFGVKGFWG